MLHILPKAFLIASLLYSFIALFLPTKASAISRWGPHLVCYSSGEMMSTVRAAYNAVENRDWIPATIIITSSDNKDTILRILADAANNKIIPIFRLEGPGFVGLLTSDEARKVAQEIAAAVSEGPAFRRRIYVEVGNEPNHWNNWGSGQERIDNYNAALSAFLDAAQGIGVLNGALDLSSASDSNTLDAAEFWPKFPSGTIARVDGTAHNPYHGIGAPAPAIRGTINSWTWERGILSSKGVSGPTFLLEFGFNPLASLPERVNFLKSEFLANRHNVEAITPLVMLHDTNTFKIAVFGPPGSGRVDLINPVGPAGSCGGAGAISVDTSILPYYGEDIKIKRKVLGGIEDITGFILRPRLLGGSRQIPFPELSSLSGFLSRALPWQLPAKIGRNLTLPNNQLKGTMFHPTCGVIGPDGTPLTDVKVGAEGNVEFSTPPFWTNLLASTQIGQAIAVSGKTSGVSLTAIQPPLPSDEEGNKQLGSCPPVGGASKEPTSVAASGQTQLSGTDIVSIIVDLIKTLGEIIFGKDITILAKPNKLLPGEAAFSRQTIKEDEGMLRSFCPQKLCPGATDESEPTPYEDIETPVGITFKGAAGALEGFDLLKKSLLPAKLQQ